MIASQPITDRFAEKIAAHPRIGIIIQQPSTAQSAGASCAVQG
jgi:hypothetical protein